ncbi:MAG: hypothetical protein AAF902_00940 [Chloroflexota bacterium]
MAQSSPDSDRLAHYSKYHGQYGFNVSAERGEPSYDRNAERSSLHYARLAPWLH